jgi:transcriptional regulator with XRE-family HTH domain
MPTARERNDDAISFGLIMRRLRSQRGWTLQHATKTSGMNARYLGSTERGGNVPSISTLILLSNVHGVDSAEVLKEMIEFRETLMLRRG